jgi:integrase/recombinase XerD
MHTYWSDINLAHATVRVSHKPDRGWTPKAYKEREIPIPAKLVKNLKARKAKSDKTCSLVFPTAGCNPKLDFLDCLKAVAGRAKLDDDNHQRGYSLRNAATGLIFVARRAGT